jgi:hypothetical protein
MKALLPHHLTKVVFWQLEFGHVYCVVAVEWVGVF